MVFHAERGLEWVALAQKHQHALATALFAWSCATVTVAFYATFLPALICAPLSPRPVGMQSGDYRPKLLASNAEAASYAQVRGHANVPTASPE